MLTYELNFNWEISLPDNWTGEYDSENGEYIFYPPDSSLTIRVTPFHAEKGGVPAPKELMKNAYINSASKSAVPRDIWECGLDGFSMMAYEDTQKSGGQTVYVISAGYFTEGELLSVNIYSTDKSECDEAVKYIKTLSRKDALQ